MVLQKAQLKERRLVRQKEQQMEWRKEPQKERHWAQQSRQWMVQLSALSKESQLALSMGCELADRMEESR